MSAISALPSLALCLIAALPAPPAEDAPKLDGIWIWTWKDGQGATHKHVLDVTPSADKPAVRERFDEEAAVKVSDLKQDGKKVRFSVVRGARTATYTGTATGGDTIEGKVVVSGDGQSEEFSWTARRKPIKP